MNKIFLDACKNGQKAVVNTLLKRGDINVNKRDENGYSPLYYACKEGMRDIVKILLENGADASLASNISVTPLHGAVQGGNIQIIQMLLNAGADINAADEAGRNVLMYGIQSGKVASVRYLIQLGADTSMTDNENRTAKDYANIAGHIHLFEELGEREKTERDVYGNTPLHLACENGQSEMVKMILKKSKADINKQNDYQSYNALLYSHSAAARYLVKKGATAILSIMRANRP